MGFPARIFGTLVDRLVEMKVRWESKGCARVLLWAFAVMIETHKRVAPTHAWVACKALETRPSWTRNGERTFVFKSNGEEIEILDSFSMLDVIHRVIDVELRYNLRAFPSWRAQELLLLGHLEADRYISRKR